MSKLLNKIVPIFIAVVAIVALVSGYSFYMEYLEHREIGADYTAVFLTNLLAKVAVYAVSFVISLVVLLISGKAALNMMKKRGVTLFEKNTPFVLITLLMAMFISMAAGELSFEKVLVFFNGTQYGMEDPVFHMDISYYLFSRPFLLMAAQTASVILLVNLLLCGAIYIVAYLKLNPMQLSDIFYEKDIMLHMGWNIVLFVAVKAYEFYLGRADMLFGTFAGGITGAGFVDHVIWKYYYIIAPILLIAVCIGALVLLYKGRKRAALRGVLVFPLVTALAFVAAWAIQGFYVSPSEAKIESDNIKANIEFTQVGYNLTNIKEIPFTVENNLTGADIAENAETIDNVRITDVRATLTASNTLQATRSYYSFVDSDIVPYRVDGNIVALNSAVRELNKERLTEQNYINQRLRYTHGYGVVMNPVNKVTADGQPQYVVGDVPVRSDAGMPVITNPEVYFGELTNDYVIANNGYNELSYMQDGGAVEKNYDGAAGIAMTGLNRLLFSIRNMDWTMLISGYIDSESKLLINRNIIERAQKIAPYLLYDNDPYIVVDGQGRLKWVIDAYTVSSQFPYSQTYYENINYIRNSAKVIIDAYDGTTDFYIIDATDPIINTYANIYPSVFKTEPIPADIAEHFVYPESYFTVQTTVYQRYHVEDPQTFYGRSDIWSKATEKYSDQGEVEIEPYYNVMKLQADDASDLVLMMPFTPAGKQNLVGWMGAYSNSENYGDMIVYTFPEGQSVDGTMLVENRIDQDTYIAQQLALWNRNGSSVLRGNVLIIPVNSSLLYVEPVYISSGGESALPQMKKVILGYNDKVVMGDSIHDAVGQLFGEAQAVPQPPTEDETAQPPVIEVPPADGLQTALDAYDRAKAASQAGDWTAFGAAMDELDRALEALK